MSNIPVEKRVTDNEIKEALLAVGGIYTAAVTWLKHKKDKEMKKHHKDKEKAHKKKKHHDWLKKELRDIEEKYDETIEKIEDSSFADHNKEILRQQAQASKDLAIKQAKEINELRMQQSEAREAMADEIAAEKDNRKAIEEISDIN